MAIQTILVVDDDASLREILTEKLENENFKVLTAINGEEGLQTAKVKHPDLILLDINMPIMDGLEMLKFLRKDDWGKEVPVILLTIVREEEKIAEAIEKEACDYIIKSNWDLDKIVEKIRSKLS
ncbi:MAG: response regulator [Patescibacteria group bacterium]